MSSPSLSSPDRFLPDRRLEGDVLLAEQARLADLRDRVVGERRPVADPQREHGVPPDALDVGHLADGDVVHHDHRAGDDVEDVGELGGDLEAVVPVDGRARERQVVGAVELAAAEKERGRGHDRRHPGSSPHERPPPISVARSPAAPSLA